MQKSIRQEHSVLILMTALVGGLGGTGTGLAADPVIKPVKDSVTPHPAFKKLDTDKDNFISREEASRMQGLSEIFDQADTNRDGKLDAAEFNRAVGSSGKP
jgi:hypothetical protein